MYSTVYEIWEGPENSNDIEHSHAQALRLKQRPNRPGGGNINLQHLRSGSKSRQTTNSYTPDPCKRKESVSPLAQHSGFR